MLDVEINRAHKSVIWNIVKLKETKQLTALNTNFLKALLLL